MNKSLNILRTAVLALTVWSVAGCGLYGKFESPEYEETAQAYGDVAVTDSLSMGDVCWRDFFSDEKLVALIDSALVRNADLAVAMYRIDEAQASLKSARLAYIPSFDVSPNAAYAHSFDEPKGGAWSYSLPVNASWQIDVFGRLTNAKRRSLAALMSSLEYKRAVQSNLVATVASQYYTLLALDAQYEIYKQTESNWKENVRMTRHLMEAGRYTAAAVYQAEANYYSVCTYLTDIRQQISRTENQINSLLGRVSGTPVDRGSLADWSAPQSIQVGYPVAVLANRPDVKQAEYQYAQAFYGTNAARAAMYPSINIQGSFNFYDMLASAVFSLVQPIFQSGQLRANLKVAKAQQAEAEVSFRQTIIDAGIEVNNAVIAVKAAQEKSMNYDAQVKSLEGAVESTRQMMEHKSSTYLEVLTAQQSLLNAQISSISNKLTEISGVITLYQALGGGE